MFSPCTCSFKIPEFCTYASKKEKKKNLEFLIIVLCIKYYSLQKCKFIWIHTMIFFSFIVLSTLNVKMKKEKNISLLFCQCLNARVQYQVSIYSMYTHFLLILFSMIKINFIMLLVRVEPTFFFFSCCYVLLMLFDIELLLNYRCF